MELNFLTTPVPHEEARRRIADKPAVARDVFDRLPEEMQARAFTITGIEDMDVVQAVRDEIAKLPAGADWDKVKKEVMAKISPWFTPEGAAARAQTIMSHHAFAAYSSTQARIMDEMIDVFPYRQYLSTKDGKVRASHAALHEIILPANHEFWTYHTPPWEWNCRCQVVELTEEDRDEELANDAKRAPENRRVLQGSALKQLDQGSLNRGLSTNVDVRTPKERGGNYQWSARDTTLPYEEIKTRWDAQTAADFETWAGKQAVGLDNLLDVLQGRAVFREARIPGAGGMGRVIEAYVEEAKALAAFSAVREGSEMLSSTLPATNREALRVWEMEHARAEVEHGLLLDKQGGVIGRSVGTRTSVPLPDGPAAGNLFVHNHPARSSFSDRDLRVLFARRLGEVMVTNQQGSYSVSRRPPHALGAVLDRMTEVADDMEASIATLKISAGEKERLREHAIWTRLAREGLINYHFTPMRPDSPLSQALSAEPTPQPGFMERGGWDKLRDDALANPEKYAYSEEELAAAEESK